MRKTISWLMHGVNWPTIKLVVQTMVNPVLYCWKHSFSLVSILDQSLRGFKRRGSGGEPHCAHWESIVHTGKAQYNTIQYNTMQYNTTQHNTTQYRCIRHYPPFSVLKFLYSCP